MAVDSSHPFPFLTSKSLNIAMLLERNERDMSIDEENDIDVKTAVVPVPSVLSRIIAIPATGNEKKFIFLEDVLMHFASRFSLATIYWKHILSVLLEMPICILMKKMRGI